MARRTSTGSLIVSVLLFCAAVAFAIGTLLFWVLTQNSGESAYGRIGIPGSQSVVLPQGRVDLTFTMDLSNQTVAIPILDISVQSADGGHSPAVSARIGEPLDVNGVTHIRVGTVTIDRAGTYRVSVDGYVSASPNPQLLIGRVANHAPFIAAGFGIAGVLLLGGIVSIVLIGRRWPVAAETPVRSLTADLPSMDGYGDAAATGGLSMRASRASGSVRPAPGTPDGGLTPAQSAAAQLDGGASLGLQPATATVIAVHDAPRPALLPGLAPPGGVVDLTVDVSLENGEGYATTTRVAFRTPARRAAIATVGRTLPVLVDPAHRDRIAIDGSRIDSLPD